jgi:hypothetical protein
MTVSFEVDGQKFVALKIDVGALERAAAAA